MARYESTEGTLIDCIHFGTGPGKYPGAGRPQVRRRGGSSTLRSTHYDELPDGPASFDGRLRGRDTGTSRRAHPLALNGTGAGPASIPERVSDPGFQGDLEGKPRARFF